MQLSPERRPVDTRHEFTNALQGLSPFVQTHCKEEQHEVNQVWPFWASRCFAAASAALAQNEQFIPVLSYRVGPYAAGGSGYYGGAIDYWTLVNMTGGVNGVKLLWEECETEYNAVERCRMLRAAQEEERRRDDRRAAGPPASPTACSIASRRTRFR